MLWELRTYTFYPGRRESYLDLWEQEILPIYDEIGVRVVGCWLPDDDENQYVWLRVYDDLAERDVKTVALRSRPEWPDIWRRIQERESGTATQDLIPTTFTAIDEAIRARAGQGGDPYALYEIRRLTIKPGARSEFLSLYEHGFAPIAEDAGLTVLGTWLPEGDPDGFVVLRAFRSEGERDAAMQRVRDDSRAKAVIGQFQQLESGVTMRLLRSTRFTPIGRYLD